MTQINVLLKSDSIRILSAVKNSTFAASPILGCTQVGECDGPEISLDPRMKETVA